jgi:lipoprotein-anchoring transpeptidase ErfK/SrfK
VGKYRCIPVLAVACALVAPAAAGAQDARVIAVGASAGGVDVGGLTVDQAAAKLDQALTPALTADVVVGVAGRSFKLTAKQARLRFDALTTAKRAFYAGEQQPPPPPDAAAAGGTAAGAVVPLAVSHAHLAVRDFAAGIGVKVDRAARDATVRLGVQHMRIIRAKPGHRADRTAIAKAVDTALDDPAALRRLHFKVVPVRPKLDANGVRRVYGTVLTVDRGNHVLRLFKRLRFAKRYGVAVGMAGLETPPGTYRIQNKQVNPSWHVPNSPWAGSLAGHVIPGGAPDNPLKARWMGIYNGVGIHGTAEDWSIGSNASHGCIRMHVSDVIDLYPRVPVGTAVLIK